MASALQMLRGTILPVRVGASISLRGEHAIHRRTEAIMKWLSGLAVVMLFWFSTEADAACQEHYGQQIRTDAGTLFTNVLACSWSVSNLEVIWDFYAFQDGEGNYLPYSSEAVLMINGNNGYMSYSESMPNDGSWWTATFDPTNPVSLAILEASLSSSCADFYCGYLDPIEEVINTNTP